MQGVPPHNVKLIDCRPDAWIRENMNARNYPAIFIWLDRYNLSESQMPNVADTSTKVTITCLHHSSDPDYIAFDEDKGVFALNAAALTVLAKNKKLRTDTDPTGLVRGLRLPIGVQAVEREDGTAFIIGTVAMVEFFSHDVPWTSVENNESSFI
jgi:hypothetical protein